MGHCRERFGVRSRSGAGRFVEHGPCAAECLLETFTAERLQQMVDGGRFERGDRVLIVGGGEDDRGFVRCVSRPRGHRGLGRAGGKLPGSHDDGEERHSFVLFLGGQKSRKGAGDQQGGEAAGHDVLIDCGGAGSRDGSTNGDFSPSSGRYRRRTGRKISLRRRREFAAMGVPHGSHCPRF